MHISQKKLRLYFWCEKIIKLGNFLLWKFNVTETFFFILTRTEINVDFFGSFLGKLIWVNRINYVIFKNSELFFIVFPENKQINCDSLFRSKLSHLIIIFKVHKKYFVHSLELPLLNLKYVCSYDWCMYFLHLVHFQSTGILQFPIHAVTIDHLQWGAYSFSLLLILDVAT